jgi:hypothetical protein
MIERVAADLLRLELLDEKIAAGSMTDHDGRVAHALRNGVRLVLRELGIESPVSAKPSSLDSAELVRASIAAIREMRGSGP